MNLTKRNKVIIAAAALAGAAAVTGSAFTAGGLSDTSNDNFIGGTVDQIISGATITNVDYDIDNDNDDRIASITVTASGDVNGRELDIEFYDVSDAEIGVYTCTDFAASVSTCTPGTPVISDDVERVVFRVDN